MNSIKPSILFWISIFLLPIGMAYAQDKPVNILNTKNIVKKQIKIYEDFSGHLSFEDISKLSDAHFSFHGPLADSDNVYWAKVSFTNPLDYALDYLLYIGKNDYADVYVVHGNGHVEHYKCGYYYPVSAQTVVLGDYYVPLMLGPQETAQYYIRVYDPNHKNPKFDLKIESRLQWADKLFAKKWMDLFFQGILAIMGLYSLFVFFSFREKSYLYYAAYLGTIFINYLMLTGLLRIYIFSENPKWSPYFMAIIPVTAALYFLFMREFLDIKKKLPHWDVWIKRLILFDLGIFFLILVLYHFTQYPLLSARIVQALVLTNCGVTVFICYSLYKFYIDDLLVRYYLAGTSIFLVCAFGEISFWEPDSSEGVIVKFGLIGEILFYSIGLGQKLKIDERRKRTRQEELISQLKKNEGLAQWQKEELEKIIDSRTRKIKKQNKKLSKAVKKANKAAKAKSAFLSVMSHEIRTPMNAVIGMIHLLLEESPKKGQMENLSTLKYSAENLMVLINDILDYSKVESGKIALEHTSFDLRHLTKAIGSAFELPAQESGIQFSILIDQKIPSQLRSDPGRLTQILNNLISNAIKFTPNGYVKLFINLIHKSRRKVQLEFAVEDSGIGISQDKQEMIFQSFTQAQLDTTRKYGGTGLGLAITKKLLRLFDSQIFVESKLHKGSKFYFALDLEIDRMREVNEEKDHSETILQLKDKNILAVDDNEINLLMLGKFLSKWDIRFQTALDGKTALQKIFDEDFDLILLDLQMPGMDGYQVASTIRSLDNHSMRDIPIVAVSADTLDNVKDRIKTAGISGFLSKPFNPSELLEVLDTYTSGKYPALN